MYWLIPDHGHHGDPWIFMRMGDGTRQWYMVRDKDDRRYFDRRAGPMANRFGIDISLASHNRFLDLLGEDWLLSYPRPDMPSRAAATVKATAEAHAPPTLTPAAHGLAALCDPFQTVRLSRAEAHAPPTLTPAAHGLPALCDTSGWLPTQRSRSPRSTAEAKYGVHLHPRP